MGKVTTWPSTVVLLKTDFRGSKSLPLRKINLIQIINSDYIGLFSPFFNLFQIPTIWGNVLPVRKKEGK